jgi:hypothetical protein
MTYHSNLDVFFSVAEESYSTMKDATAAGRRPNPDGSGYILSWDVTRTSFKHACITVAFAAMYFEALIYLLALRDLGKEEAIKIDRMLYEARLEKIGVTDPDLLIRARQFREARKELIHEKAIDLNQPTLPPPRYAQKMADDAMQFITDLRAHLLAA